MSDITSIQEFMDKQEFMKPMPWNFIVVGISDSHSQIFAPEVMDVIRCGKVFSGGRRHREIMEPHLPEDAVWIDVTVPLADVFRRYEEYPEIVVFASGDPLFFGFAATLQREFPETEIKVYPSFNSLQNLAHRINLPYQEMINVSLTGRPWKNLDDALIAGYSLIGCLTDRRKGPAEIAARMLEYGYDNYDITVGTSLGNEERERVLTLTLPEAAGMGFELPNCVILQKQDERRRWFGLPESEFYHLDGRGNMITKMPMRLMSLAMLNLKERRSFWDVGFCTGSVSIEARLQCPHLNITSFEIREESRGLMEMNCRKFGAPSINAVIGDFFNADLAEYPRPDAVFIGGHGGRLREMVDRLAMVLLPGGVMVFNSVSAESCASFREAVAAVGMKIVEEHVLAYDSFNPITILKAQ